MDLQPKQREALDAPLSGASMTEAAATAGVHRATLHNWYRENTIFRAATLILQAVTKTDPYTQPAVPRLTTAAVDNIFEGAAQVGSEEQILRETQATSPPESQTPRSAPLSLG